MAPGNDAAPTGPRRAPLLALALALLALVLAAAFWRRAPPPVAPPAERQAEPAARAAAPAPAIPPPAGPAPSNPVAPVPSTPAQAPAPGAPPSAGKATDRTVDYSSIDERTRNLFYRRFKAQRGAEVERCLQAFRPPSLAELKEKARHETPKEPPVGAPFTWVHVDLEIDFEQYTDGYAFGHVEATTTELELVEPEDHWTIAIDDPSLAGCIAKAYADVRVPVRGVTAAPPAKLTLQRTLTLPANPQ